MPNTNLHPITLGLAAVISSGACSLAHAGLVLCSEDQQHPVVVNQDAGGQLSWDNDFFARLNKDRWYTNGVKFTKNYKDGCRDNWLTKGLYWSGQRLMWDGDEAVPQTMSYSIGQTMYTPDDIAKPEFQPGERPYSAFLYVAAAERGFRGNEYRSTELKVGTTGSAALGFEAQRAIHWLVNSEFPRGWGNQLPGRVGVQLSHARSYSYKFGIAEDYLGWQYGWHIAAGTLRDYAEVTGALIVGQMGKRVAPVQIGNEGDFVDLDLDDTTLLSHVYAFAAVTGTAVAYNYFLQAQPAVGHTDIRMRRRYTTTQLGVSLPASAPVSAIARFLGCDGKVMARLVYSSSVRSKEFDGIGLAESDKRQRWGTLTLVVDN